MKNQNNHILVTENSLLAENILKKFPLSSSAKNILQKMQMAGNVEFKICRIEGVDFVVSKVGLDHYYVFFAEQNGEWKPRLVRYSSSGGKHHIFPGVRNDGAYSKWENIGLPYENGVTPDFRLEQFLIKEQTLDNSVKLDGSVHQILQELKKMWYDENNILPDSAKNEFEILTGLQNNANIPSLSDLKQVIETSENLKNIWKKIESEKNREIFGENIEISSIYTKKIYPEIMNDEMYFKETFFAVVGNLQWKDVIMKISHYLSSDEIQKNEEMQQVAAQYNKKISQKIPFENEHYWVEDFYVQNGEINSYGISHQKFDMGIICAKPEDYGLQVPKYMNPKWEKSPVYIAHHMQENPFIVAFKKFQQEQKIKEKVQKYSNNVNVIF